MSKGPVIVTGVAGFIGSHVARHFSQEGWAVIGVDRASADHEVNRDLSSFHALTLPDVSFDRLLRETAPQLCIHCAGTASVGASFVDVAADFYGNAVLTFEVLNALRLNVPACRFVFLSSAAVYGNPGSLPIGETQPPAPISPYGYHKLQCEQLCGEFFKVYGMPAAMVRIFSAYGPGLRRQVIWDICRKAAREQSIVLQGTGRESRDFIHVRDIARALAVIATSAPMEAEAYNLGSGQETTIADLAGLIVTSLDSRCSVTFDGVLPPGTPQNWRADISRIQSLGFSPTISLKEGIAGLVPWYRSEWNRTCDDV